VAIDMRSEIEEALDKSGIDMDAARFVDLLREALGSVGHRRRDGDPAGRLTVSDLEELRAGGLEASADLVAYDEVRARTAAQTAALLATSLSTAQAAKRLGVDSSRVRQMLGDRSLLGMKDGSAWRILEIQFEGRGLVPNVRKVARAIPEGLPLLGVVNWLTTPEPDLEFDGQPLSPLQWLSAGGDAESVSALAADL